MPHETAQVRTGWGSKALKAQGLVSDNTLEVEGPSKELPPLAMTSSYHGSPALLNLLDSQR